MWWWRKTCPLSDFDDEIQAHLQLEADERAERRTAADDHQGAARRAFGNITLAKEAFYEHDKWRAWDQITRDLRHAGRLFRRRLGFSAVVVSTLAVGIGASAAIFSIINAVLFHPLPSWTEPLADSWISCDLRLRK